MAGQFARVQRNHVAAAVPPSGALSNQDTNLVWQSWLPAALDGRLAVGEVHVWLAMLRELPPFAWETVLSPDEHDRAARFVFARDRERFVTVRGLLRRLLACYLGTTPESVRFSYEQYGKPSLVAYPGAPSFNLSHSQDAAVFAVTRENDVGIDIEALRPVRAAGQIADRYFAREDAEALRSVPLPERERAFFRCWARREAFVKAVGRGLSLPLDSSDAAATPGQPDHVAQTETAGSSGSRWRLTELPGVEGYVGALAVRGSPGTIRYRAWNGSECQPDTGRGAV
jgi:4'-phosphopantetheinyl transferase